MEEIYKLTRQEVGQAIVHYIGIMKAGKNFFPCQILKSSPELKIPSEVTFELKYIPKGSYYADYPHMIGGEK